MQTKMIVRSVAYAITAMAAGQVSASGFQLLEQNASGLGNAYAGSAVVGDNASTIFFNPAGMTKLQDREISLGGNLISPSYKFKDGGTSNAPASTGGNGGDAGSLALVPNTYMSMALNKRLYVGLGISVPFGLKTEYDPEWAGRFQAIEFDIKTTNLNPSIAFRATDKLSLGFGLNYQTMEAKYVRKAAVVNAFAQNTTVELKANDNTWGWNAGAIYKVSETTQLGFSYRSRMKYRLEGTLNSNNQLVAANSDAMANIDLPDTFIFSVSQKLGDKWEMLGDVSRTRWSSINKVEIQRTSGAQSGVVAQTLDAHFKDTWRVALGATYTANSAWKLKYGIAYDQSPVRNAEERLVSLPDSDRIWLSGGVQYKLTKASAVDVGIAYVMARDAQIDNNQSAQGRGRVTGSYKGSVAIVGAQYSMAF